MPADDDALLGQSPAVLWPRPVSTYRIQLGTDFTFQDAQDLLPYLVELGITECYLSPFLQPCGEASHGYYVADHGRINEALGGESAYQAFPQRLVIVGTDGLIDFDGGWGSKGGPSDWDLEEVEKHLRAALPGPAS